MAKKIGVLLSGCGYLDGAEIQESVCALLALDEAGAAVRFLAPNVEFDTVNHQTGEATGEKRSVIEEAARITRGNVEDVATVSADEFDGLVLPGGFGAAKNLSDFATRGAEMSVQPDVAKLVSAVHAAGKPIGAICIAPAILAKLLPGVRLTIGTDAGTAEALESMGCSHQDCPVTDFVIDAENKVVSTPAYMLGPWIKDINAGIRRCIDEVLAMIP